MIKNIKRTLETIAENTLSQTATYNDAIIVNVLQSIMRTAQKTITTDVTGKQALPKQIILYRGDTAEIYGEGTVATEAQVNYHYAWNFAEVFIAMHNKIFVRAPLEALQLTGITIREKDEDGNWSERLVDLITLQHPDSIKVSFVRRSAFYYRNFSQMMLEGFVEIIDQQRRQV